MFFFHDDDDDYVQSNSWWWADFFFRWLDDVWNLTYQTISRCVFCGSSGHWGEPDVADEAVATAGTQGASVGIGYAVDVLFFRKSHHEDVQSLFFLNHGDAYYKICFDHIRRWIGHHNKIVAKSAGVLSSPQPLLALSSSRRWTRKGFEKSPGFSPWKQPLGWDWVWWNMME